MENHNASIGAHSAMKKTVLRYLKEHYSLGSNEARDLWGLSELADFIGELRAEGHDIRALLEAYNGASERFVLYIYYGSDKH